MGPVLVGAKPNLAGFLVEVRILIVRDVASILTGFEVSQCFQIEEPLVIDNRALESRIGSVSQSTYRCHHRVVRGQHLLVAFTRLYDMGY